MKRKGTYDAYMQGKRYYDEQNQGTERRRQERALQMNKLNEEKERLQSSINNTGDMLYKDYGNQDVNRYRFQQGVTTGSDRRVVFVASKRTGFV